MNISDAVKAFKSLQTLDKHIFNRSVCQIDVFSSLTQIKIQFLQHQNVLFFNFWAAIKNWKSFELMNLYLLINLFLNIEALFLFNLFDSIF